MYEDGWNRFKRTGQIRDYLTYKGHPTAENKAGETCERRNAGIRNHDRHDYQTRTNR